MLQLQKEIIAKEICIDKKTTLENNEYARKT